MPLPSVELISIIVKSENKFTLVARRGWVTLEETPQQKPPTVPLCVQIITGSTINALRGVEGQKVLLAFFQKAVVS